MTNTELYCIYHNCSIYDWIKENQTDEIKSNGWCANDNFSAYIPQKWQLCVCARGWQTPPPLQRQWEDMRSKDTRGHQGRRGARSAQLPKTEKSASGVPSVPGRCARSTNMLLSFVRHVSIGMPVCTIPMWLYFISVIHSLYYSSLQSCEIHYSSISVSSYQWYVCYVWRSDKRCQTLKELLFGPKTVKIIILRTLNCYYRTSISF